MEISSGGKIGLACEPDKGILSTCQVDGGNLNPRTQPSCTGPVGEADKARFYKRLGEMEALRAPPATP